MTPPVADPRPVRAPRVPDRELERIERFHSHMRDARGPSAVFAPYFDLIDARAEIAALRARVAELETERDRMLTNVAVKSQLQIRREGWIAARDVVEALCRNCDARHTGYQALVHASNRLRALQPPPCPDSTEVGS